MSRNRRQAFTLVEMLVVIAIIGILVGLLLPAVQMAREAGRRADCVNNLSQIVKATINYEGRVGRYPGSQELLLPMSPGAIPAGQPGYNKPASWVALLLADLGRADLQERWDSTLIGAGDPVLWPTLAFTRCPSASVPTAQEATTSYVANAGFMPRLIASPPSSWVDPAPLNTPAYLLDQSQRVANGVFLDRISWPNRQVRSADIRDGETNTILFSENLPATFWYSFGPLDPTLTSFVVTRPGWSGPVTFPVAQNARFGNTFVWCYAHEPNGPTVNPSRPAPEIPPDPRLKINGERLLYGVGSALDAVVARPSADHPGGVNVAFADGRVIFLNDEIQYHVLQALCTPYGTQSDVPANLSYVLRDQDYGGN